MRELSPKTLHAVNNLYVFKNYGTHGTLRNAMVSVLSILHRGGAHGHVHVSTLSTIDHRKSIAAFSSRIILR